MQIPRYGTPRSTASRSASATGPARAPATAAKPPWPGTITRSALRMKSGSRERSTATRPSPAVSTAFATDRKLPIPTSTTTARMTLLRERSLRGRDAGGARIDLDRLAQGAGEGLEAHLHHVVQVRAFDQPEVQIRLSRSCERLEEDFGELHVPVAELGLRKRDSKHEKWPSRKIERGGDERLVHRKR